MSEFRSESTASTAPSHPKTEMLASQSCTDFPFSTLTVFLMKIVVISLKITLSPYTWLSFLCQGWAWGKSAIH
jgi:hypothetical protein